MKRTIVFGLSLVIAFSFFGCKSNDITEKITTETTTVAPTEETETLPPYIPDYITPEDLKKPTPDPEPLEESDLYYSMFPDEKMESDYSNLVFRMEKSQYSLKDEKITGIMTNTHAGYTFRLYNDPCIERYTDGEWVRLPYYTPGMFNEGVKWLYVIQPDNPDSEFSLSVDIYTEYLHEELTPGKYRLVAFAGDRKYYGEFEITE